MVRKLCPTSRFNVEFLDYVFRIMAGHTGAVRDLLRIVSAHNVSLCIKLWHLLIPVSSHTMMSSMMAENICWKRLRANFPSRMEGLGPDHIGPRLPPHSKSDLSLQPKGAGLGSGLIHRVYGGDRVPTSNATEMVSSPLLDNTLSLNHNSNDSQETINLFYLCQQ